MILAYAFALFVATAFSLWLAASVARFRARDEVGPKPDPTYGQGAAGSRPGVEAFTWLLVFVAIWSGLGGVHALVPTLAAKILVSKFQYIGICGVPPLWMLFAAEYADVRWAASRRVRGLLVVMPALILTMVFTNELHHGVWQRLTLAADGFAVYEHGWFFWVSTVYQYTLFLAGTLLVVRAARQSPASFRGQLIALVCAAVLPWLGNLLFVTGATHPGVDLTPIGFTLACILIGSALYRNHLFDLVPVARDLIVDSLADAVIVVDPARRIVDMNAAALQLIRPGHAWLGEPVGVVIPLLGDTPCEPSGGDTSTLLLTTGNESRYYEMRAISLPRRRGGRAGCVILLRDTTTERAAAAEREALQMRVQEQQRRESLSILAGGLAHDFNNLLTGIVGNADLLSLSIPASSEMGASVGAIQLGAQRAADLVAKMLAYAGERHGSPAPLDVDALVREILDLLRASAARHCEIEYTGERAIIHADPTQIRQVVMNLIINAADAVDERSGKVIVTTGSEPLTAEQLRDMKFGEEVQPGEYAFIEVRDNGAGMNEETLRRIFNPFFTTKPDGHGLGLSAVQGIVLGHRGALRVDSSVGHGSRFCVWFPLADSCQGAGHERGQGAGLSQEEGTREQVRVLPR